MSQYQLFPDLQKSEYDELKSDIAERGVMVPVEYDEEGNILDGHHRKKICDELEITDFPRVIRYGMSEVEKRQHVRKLNLARRHLTKEQRNQIIKDMRTDGMSIPAIAEVANVGQGTVQRAVEGLPIGKGVTGKDGKTYPATKPRKPSVIVHDEKQHQQAMLPEVAQKISSGKSATLADATRKVHTENNSIENEWYTPPEWIEAARRVMGGIDLDPASSETAQENVQAKTFFTIAEDGLSKVWRGRVWMNPPYSRDLCAKFTDKLIWYFNEGEVKQACVLVNNATDTLWLQSLLKSASAVCFPSGRISFLDRSGKPANKPLQGQLIAYLGSRKEEFCTEFETRGAVLFGSCP